MADVARTPEDLAAFLHDEIHGHDWSWPEHDDDALRQRGDGGYVRLTPSDVRQECREEAARIWTFLRLDALQAGHLARAHYEAARQLVEGRPSWENLDQNDPYDMGMRAAAFAAVKQETTNG